MKFVIPGNPIAKKRHRYFVRKNKNKFNVQNYDPQSDDKRKVQGQMLYQLTMALKDSNKEIATEASNLAKNCAFEVDMTFHMPVAESSTNSKRNAKFWNLVEHTLKPDLDNLEKFYLDCGNGIMFPDDKHVTKVTKKKLFSHNPRTEIVVKAIKEISLPYYTSILAPLIDKEQLLRLAKDLNFLSTLGFSYYETMSQEQQMAYIESLASFLMDFSKNWSTTLSKIAKKSDSITKEEVCKKKQL
jgi:Holliday junction resolvase